MTDPMDPYVFWDAAYVLGSLSSTERRDYETHLSRCRACRSAVGDLSGMPALLTLLSRDEVAVIDEQRDPPSMRPQMLDVLLDRVSRQRRRARWRTGMMLAAAAAVIAAVFLVAVKPGPFDTTPPAPVHASPISLSMTPVSPSSLEAAVVVTSQPWGTHIQMTCTYHASQTGADHDDNGEELAMFAVGRDGTRLQLATWTAVEGRTASPAGSTSMPADKIAAVQIASVATGGVLMQHSL